MDRLLRDRYEVSSNIPQPPSRDVRSDWSIFVGIDSKFRRFFQCQCDAVLLESIIGWVLRGFVREISSQVEDGKISLLSSSTAPEQPKIHRQPDCLPSEKER